MISRVMTCGEISYRVSFGQFTLLHPIWLGFRDSTETLPVMLHICLQPCNDFITWLYICLQTLQSSMSMYYDYN